MYFIISIDTEEDNWNDFFQVPTLKNIRRIPIIQEIFNQYDVHPTYLTTYTVACDETSVSILKPILDEGQCEIGTHLHPWNTTPFEEALNDKNTMLNNIHRELQYQKLHSLHNRIIDNFHTPPQSFRAGRYGMNGDMAYNLERLNYVVDSSITPFMDWRYFHGPDFSAFTRLTPYRFSTENITKENEKGGLIEMPLTGGFYQPNFKAANLLLRMLKKKPFKFFRLIGLFAKLGLLNLVRLSPEGYTANEMKKLISTLMKKNIHVLNMSFHSNTLLPGCTPFVSTENQLQTFLRTIEDVIIYMQDLGFRSITLSEVQSILTSKVSESAL